jgi:hypothetical protein
MYSQFNSTVTVTLDGSTVTLKSNGVPDHPSPYFGSGSANYESPQAGMVVNPNVIVTQSITMRVPASPMAATASDTPLGPIGLATNGVALFNQYAAGRSPLGAEILTFDRYNGHPQNTGLYHYHLEPLWLTGRRGAATLIGVLLDGFPVYGPAETDGSSPKGLDSCNGHTRATTDVPERDRGPGSDLDACRQRLVEAALVPEVRLRATEAAVARLDRKARPGVPLHRGAGVVRRREIPAK